MVLDMFGTRHGAPAKAGIVMVLDLLLAMPAEVDGLDLDERRRLLDLALETEYGPDLRRPPAHHLPKHPTINGMLHAIYGGRDGWRETAGRVYVYLTGSGRVGDDAVPDAESGDDDGGRRSTADRLVDLAMAGFRLSVSTAGEPFAVTHNGPNIALMLRGDSSLRSRLAADYHRRFGKVPASSALADALTVIEGMALDGAAEEVHLRRALVDDAVFVDLARPDGRMVRIDPDGWTLVDRAPVLFRRSPLIAETPLPQRGGSLNDLRDFVHVDDAGFDLLVGFLVSASIPGHPHPGVAMHGEQGTGKTTTAKTLVDLLDRSHAAVRSVPREITDWVVVAAGSSVVALDNLSSVPFWLSDAMCRAVTGEAFPRRRLYSDGDIVLTAFKRTIILTGIDFGALRGDLLDRLILLELDRIPDSERRTDRELAADWAMVHPFLLGALFDAVAVTLAHLDRVHLDGMPRMADHARILAALDAATGSTTLPSYLRSVTDAQATVVESDHIAAAVRSMMAGAHRWQGTATDLLDLLTPDRPPKGWPTTPHHLGGRLRRATPALRAVGIEVTHHRDGQHRTIAITKDGGGKQASQATQASPDDADDTDDAQIPLPSDGEMVI
jgi:hypothetical protein